MHLTLSRSLFLFASAPHHHPRLPGAAATALPPNLKGGEDETSPDPAVKNTSPNNAPTGGLTDRFNSATNDPGEPDGTTPSAGTLGGEAGAAGRGFRREERH